MLDGTQNPFFPSASSLPLLDPPFAVDASTPIARDGRGYFVSCSALRSYLTSPTIGELTSIHKLPASSSYTLSALRPFLVTAGRVICPVCESRCNRPRSPTNQTSPWLSPTT